MIVGYTCIVTDWWEEFMKWGGVRHRQTVEKQYCERDGIIPEVTDHVVINLNPGSD
jgi:hypothetical protein